MSIKETLERFDEKFDTMPVFFERVPPEAIKQFITEEIKLAMEEVKNIELAVDYQTIKDIGNMDSYVAFGFGQGYVAEKLDKNISKYFEI